jgi:putative tricarboxylic transport membrane protein
MNKIKMPVAPMVVGLILGNMLNTSLHQSLLIGQGSWFIFLKSPIAAVLLIIAVFSVLQSTPLFTVLFKKFKKQEAQA